MGEFSVQQGNETRIVDSCIETSKRILDHQVLRHDTVLTVDSLAPEWPLGFQRLGVNFFGWGGWGDSRDEMLCEHLAQ